MASVEIPRKNRVSSSSSSSSWKNVLVWDCDCCRAEESLQWKFKFSVRCTLKAVVADKHVADFFSFDSNNSSFKFGGKGLSLPHTQLHSS